jgi:F-type H+-transporting ATPase subunit a
MKKTLIILFTITLALYITGFVLALLDNEQFDEFNPEENFSVAGAEVVVFVTHADDKYVPEGRTIELPFGVTSDPQSLLSFNLTTSVTAQFIVVAILGTLFFVLGKNLKVKPDTKKQAAAEFIVGFFTGMVKEAMGDKYLKYAPYIATVCCFSALNSLMGLLGMRSPTADISVVGTWGLCTFFLVQRNKMKTGGFWGPLKSLFEPVAPMLPINILGEITSPLTQSFRHFGNILAGTIIMNLIYWAMRQFAVVIPAFFSLYFDLFGAVIQAYIFVTLTMVYVLMAECDPPKKKAKT